MRFLLFLFILFPILEMVVLIKVGGIIGALNTVGLVLLSAFIGVDVIRRQGFRTALRARQKMAAGELPAMEVMENLAIAIGGVMMIIPGFISDGVGAALLIPPLRRWLIGRWMKGFGIKVQQSSVYEAEFHREWPQDKHHAERTINQHTTKTDNQQSNHTLEGDFTREPEEAQDGEKRSSNNKGKSR